MLTSQEKALPRTFCPLFAACAPIPPGDGQPARLGYFASRSLNEILNAESVVKSDRWLPVHETQAGMISERLGGSMRIPRNWRLASLYL